MVEHLPREGIDDRLETPDVLHEEVSRERDPADIQIQAFRHRDVYDRERDRDPEPSLQHFVKPAVARIVVFVSISGEALLDEGLRRGPRLLYELR